MGIDDHPNGRQEGDEHYDSLAALEHESRSWIRDHKAHIDCFYCKTDQYRCELPLNRCYLLAHPLQLEILQFPVQRDHCNQVDRQK